MSALFVGNRSISQIANVGWERGWFREYAEEAEELAQVLYDMNVEALKQRYPRSWDGMVTQFEYLVRETLKDETQLFRSVGCYLYQCSEGDVSGSKLFQEMKEFKNDVAVSIADRVADAEGAKWE